MPRPYNLSLIFIHSGNGPNEGYGLATKLTLTSLMTFPA